MKRLKITSVLLSVVMCVTMAFPSFSVIADDTSEPAETQTEATEKKQEPTEPKKETPADPSKEEPAESVKQEPAESEKETPAETEKQEPTEPETEEPKESEKQEPAESKQEEPAEPAKQDPTEAETTAPEETEAEKEPEVTEVPPSEKDTKTPKNALLEIPNIKISTDGILTWDAVEGAECFDIYIRDNNSFDPHVDECVSVWVEFGEARLVDLQKEIRYFIKKKEIKKTDDNVYYIFMYALKDSDVRVTKTAAFTYEYETNVTPLDGTEFTTVNFSDAGMLTWSAVDNAHHYKVKIDSGRGGVSKITTGTSFNVADAIDNAIEERQIWKEREGFSICLEAYDIDDVELAYWIKPAAYIYRSEATPKNLPSIPDAKIENGILSWGDYTGSGFDHYYLRIVDERNEFEEAYYLNNKFTLNWKSFSQPIDLKEFIKYLYTSEGLYECSKYTIELYAVDKYQENFLAGFIQTYTYKEENTLSVSGKTAKVKKKKVKKKKQTLSVSKVIKFNNRGQGKLTYSKASGNKKITINGSTGKVTVKKKTKKGTYKVSVWVNAAGDENHSSTRKKVTFKIKVKQ